MARVVTTIRADKRRINNVVSGLRVIGSKEFIANAMDLGTSAAKILEYLKRIFPKSPPGYPFRDGRSPLVEGWRVYMHPPNERADTEGFTIRRAPRNDPKRDADIIRALDQGSRAYTRRLPKGEISSIFITDVAARNPQNAELGDVVFFTGDGLMLKFKARRGLQFMDKTYQYAMKLMAASRERYKKLAKRRIKDGY